MVRNPLELRELTKTESKLLKKLEEKIDRIIDSTHTPRSTETVQVRFNHRYATKIKGIIEGHLTKKYEGWKTSFVYERPHLYCNDICILNLRPKQSEMATA